MQEKETIAVIAGAEPITAEMIIAAPSLQVIGMHGVGLSHIDIQTAKEKGVVVKAVPGGNSEAVADLTWALMFAVARQIVKADQEVRQVHWPTIVGTSVNNKVLGIVGFGTIGQAVARRSKGFDMSVLAYDPFPNSESCF